MPTPTLGVANQFAGSKSYLVIVSAVAEFNSVTKVSAARTMGPGATLWDALNLLTDLGMTTRMPIKLWNPRAGGPPPGALPVTMTVTITIGNTTTDRQVDVIVMNDDFTTP